MKIFLTVMPRQNVFFKSEGDIRQRDTMGYRTMDCDELAYDGPCCYPVLLQIRAYVRPGEEIRVITITGSDPKNDRLCHENFELLRGELEALCTERNISFTLEKLLIPMNERIDTHLNTFQQLIDRFQNGDILYGDITYGTKPNMMVLLLALNYANQAMRNAHVESVVYGEKIFSGVQEKRIYDMTKLFLMQSISCLLGQQQVADPASVIRELIHFEPDREL